MPLAVGEEVMTGAEVGEGETVIMSVPDPVIPELLLQVRSTENEPVLVGAPLISPVAGFIASPDGRPVAPKVVAPLATT